ncbi:MAG: hypothetical protein WDM87_00915 [Terracidiphilus sp.]
MQGQKDETTSSTYCRATLRAAQNKSRELDTTLATNMRTSWAKKNPVESGLDRWRSLGYLNRGPH